MIIIGTNNIAAAYVGATAVEKAYVGNNQIYPNTSLTLSASELSFAAAGQSLTLDIVVDENKPWTITAPNDWQVSPLSGTGPAYITVTAANNTSANRRSGTLMVSSEQDAASCALTQEAGVKFFSEVTISAFSYSEISAKGGSVAPKLNYTQTWTWNAVAESGGNITTGATVVYTGDNVDTEGNVTAPSKETTISNRTQITSTSVTVTLNGKSAAAQADVYQAGNYVTKLSIIPFTLAYQTINAGATSASPTLNGGAYQFTYSSGATGISAPSDTYGILGVQITWSLGSIQNGFTAVDAKTGVLTATNRGTEIGNARISGEVTRKIDATWYPTSIYNAEGNQSATISVSATCTQALNKVVNIQFEPAAGSSSTTEYPAGDIPASGGTKIPNKSSQTKSTYSSGATEINTDGRVAHRTWSMPNATGFSLNAETGTITASSRGITIGSRRSCNPSCVLDVTFTNPESVGGDTVRDVLTESFTVYQEANYIESLKIGGSNLSTYITPGGSFSAGENAHFYTGWATVSSGEDFSVTTWVTGDWIVSQNYFSKSLSETGVLKITAESRGTTAGAERDAALTWTLTSPSTDNKTLSVTINLTQAANGVISYGIPTGRTLSVSDIPAAGGTISNGTLGGTITQTRTFSSGSSDTITTPTVTSSNYSASVSSGSLGFTVAPRTKKGTLTYFYVCNGQTGSVSADVYQQQNTVISISIIESGTNDPAVVSIPAAGGNYGYVVSPKFTSGGSGGAVNFPASVFSWNFNQSWGTWKPNTASSVPYYGQVTYESRGTTTSSDRTGSLSCTINGPINGVAVNKTTSLTITQAANTLTWNTPTISRTTPVTIAATGGTDNVATGLTYSQTGQYSSGSSASASSGGNLSYSVITAITGFSLSGSTVTATNNMSSSARNGFVVRITLTLNGETATKDITYNQAAGYFTYANPVINATYPMIPASGGTVTPTVSYSQTYGWNGATSGAGTDTTGGSISYAGSSVNTSNGSVTAVSKGAVASGVTDVTTATITVTMHGKSSNKQVKVQQVANSIERYNYGNYTASLSLNNTAALAAGATTRTVTWGYIRRSKTPVYSSGNLGSASTETWSGTAYLTVSVNSGTSYCSVNPASYTNSSSTTSSTLTKTTYGTTVISAQTYTLQVRQGSASGTVVASTSVTSNANAVTNSNYNPRITTYGTPAVSIGSGMTAAGGSATVSHSVSNTQTYNALYTSGSTGPNQTRSVAGTTTVSITSNGNSAFSLSGNTLSHRDMATTLATDSVTITAKNSGDTSKTKTANTSITNSRKATSSSGGVTTYENVIAGTITNTTIPASGGSATATAGNGSQSWNKTAVITTYTYDSGDTKQETTTAASSGKNAIAPSVSSITATASLKGRTISGQTTVKSQTVTWSGSGSKSASGSMYIYQAANSLEKYYNFTIGSFGYNEIPASGGSDTPVCDVLYTAKYTSGDYDEHGIPSGYSISYTISGSGFSINASSGVVTAQANTTTNTRSATVTATVKNSSGTSITSATTKITQDAKPGPVDIYITTSFNYATSQIQINFSSAPKDTFFIKFMGYDQLGGIWEYTTGIVPSSSTSVLFSPPGYSITDQFSIEGIGSSEYTISPSSPYETSNARYYWSSGMITMV